MRWWPRQLPPVAEDEFFHRLGRVPVGWVVALPDHGHDGGGLVAQRESRYAWSFWRADFEAKGD